MEDDQKLYKEKILGEIQNSHKGPERKFICTNCDKTSTLDPSRYAAQFRKLRDLEDPTTWFGINITHIGSYYSIIVVVTMILALVQKMVVTIIKCCVLHEDTSAVATLSRACCTELYLIGKDGGTRKLKECEMA